MSKYIRSRVRQEGVYMALYIFNKSRKYGSIPLFYYIYRSDFKLTFEIPPENSRKNFPEHFIIKFVCSYLTIAFHWHMYFYKNIF